MRLLLLSLFLIGSITFSQTTEVFVPGVGGTLFDGSLVHATDANSGQDYGTQQTILSLATFDSITDVEVINPVVYNNAGVLGGNVVFGNENMGKV